MQDAIEGFPLSPQQSDLRKLQQESKDKAAYCAQCVVQLDGQLDRNVFQMAVQHVVDRNEILRTVFYRLPGTIRPLQIVLPSQTPIISWNTEARCSEFD